MVKVTRAEFADVSRELRLAYMNNSSIALDGMWHWGFAVNGQHLMFTLDGNAIGYCCINEEGKLLQYLLMPEYNHLQRDIVKEIDAQLQIRGLALTGAYVSTAESHFLSMSFEFFKNVEVHSLLYRDQKNIRLQEECDFSMRKSRIDELNIFVGFAHAAIGAPEQWLEGYYSRLIEREELYGYWAKEQLLAAGELRRFDETQTECGELGVIVATEARGDGLGCKVLIHLQKLCKDRGLIPICSTEKQNLASQKAIERSGLVSQHRILSFTV